MQADTEQTAEGSVYMKRTWRCYIPCGIAAMLVILALAWVLRPRSGVDFFNMEQATDFYIVARNSNMDLLESRPDREEIGPLLDLLAGTSIRADGGDRTITWDTKEGIYLYHIYFNHVEEDHWALDARFSLRSDGMLYTPLYIGNMSLGYVRYRLSDCDMDAVNAELQRLLGMA